MLATLIFSAIAQQQPDLYRTIIINPTGENGYEEYIAAADLAIAGKVREYFHQVNAENASGTKLDRRRNLARQLGRIEQVVEQGNKKPVFYPGPLRFWTPLPELSHMHTLGRALVERAEVHFADGQVNLGFETLTTVIEFGRKFSGSGTIIHNLVGGMIVETATRSYANNVALLSLPAARDMQQRIVALNEAPSPLPAAMRSEMEAIVAMLPVFLDDPTRSGLTDEELERMAAIKDLSPQRKQALADDLVFAVTRHYEARLQMFERPEREWPAISRQIDELAVPEDPLANMVFVQFAVGFGRIDLIEIGRRTKFRLMVVYGEVTEYRWQHGFYPSSLSQLEDQSVTIDPLTGEPFEYSLSGLSFLLYSRGTEDTGRIDLFYTPPRSAAIKPD